MRLLNILLGLTLIYTPLAALQTIAEKKQAMQFGGADFDSEAVEYFGGVNDELAGHRERLQALYEQVELLWEQGAEESQFEDLAANIDRERTQLHESERQWLRQVSTKQRGEEYAIWYQPDTTLGQLVVDYGDRHSLYLIPTEIAAIKMSVNSSLPVPVESWGEILELLLAEQGIGVKQLNNYVKQLYRVTEHPPNFSKITERREDLQLLPRQSRVAYVMSPDPLEVASTYHLLSKFADSGQTSLELVGSQIFVMGYPEAIEELLKLADFLSTSSASREYRLIPITKMTAEEMAGILQMVFKQEDSGRDFGTTEGELLSLPPRVGGLIIQPLASLTHSLFLMGTPEDLERAEQVIKDLEGQVGDIKEKTIYYYTVRYSNPAELAQVLEQVYLLMLSQDLDREEGEQATVPQSDLLSAPNPPIFPVQGEYLRGLGESLAIDPGRIEPLGDMYAGAVGQTGNFIVDPKSSSLIMVVELDYLPKIKALLKRLDVPKKMVEIEVLLFEKRHKDSSNYGMNLLRLGASADNVRRNAVTWNDSSGPGSGILQFLLQRPMHGDFPAVDLIYNFLCNQDDVRINSAPTVTTVNQTPASIYITTELSLNTGVVELDTTKNTNVKDAFIRKQFGIFIDVLPTIHPAAEDGDGLDDCDHITMETSIVFDEQASDQNDRPEFIRRQVKNTVRVADGETLIIGGLRSKSSRDTQENIPFVCQIPGLGKLFGENQTTDNDTEMFIFITPNIVYECDEEARAFRRELLCRRPGDSAAFDQLLAEAKLNERSLRMREGMAQLLHGDTELIESEEAYDGR